MNVYLDIETIPDQSEGARDKIAVSIQAPVAMSKSETIQAWHSGEGKYKGAKEKAIEDKWRKTALDGTYGEVISISFAVAQGKIISLYRKLEESEKELLTCFVEGVKEAMKERHPYFIGHNIQFDLKFLFRRCVINNVDMPFKFPFKGRHEGTYFCTMEAWCGYGERISQDRLCKALGIEGKPDDIDGSKVWDVVQSGDIERVVEYNRDDVDKVRQIHSRLR